MDEYMKLLTVVAFILLIQSHVFLFVRYRNLKAMNHDLKTMYRSYRSEHKFSSKQVVVAYVLGYADADYASTGKDGPGPGLEVITAFRKSAVYKLIGEEGLPEDFVKDFNKLGELVTSMTAKVKEAMSEEKEGGL